METGASMRGCGANYNGSITQDFLVLWIQSKYKFSKIESGFIWFKSFLNSERKIHIVLEGAVFQQPSGLEMCAICIPIFCFCNMLYPVSTNYFYFDCYIRIKPHYMTSVAYVNNFGGVKSLQCLVVAKEIWLWAIERSIKLLSRTSSRLWKFFGWWNK